MEYTSYHLNSAKCNLPARDQEFLAIIIDVGWISHFEKNALTIKKYKMVLTQVVADRTSLKELSYWFNLGLM